MRTPRAAALLVPLLLAPALTGCIGGQDPASTDASAHRPLTALTQPIYDTLLRSAHTVQTEVDGEETASIWFDVYRPETPPEVLVPIILVMTPYQASGDVFNVAVGATQADPPVPPEQAPYDPELVDFFVPRGYAVAFADVRGNHNAGGCVDQSGPGQWRDGYAVIEWLASQPWTSGRVGMYGISYDGETQVSTALLAPPHLVTIVPTASVQSQYQYSYYGGVPYEGGALNTMAGYAAISLLPGTDPNGATHYPERLDCQPDNFEAALDMSGDWSAYWDDRAYWKLASQTRASVLHIHGLADWNVKPDNIDPLFNTWPTEKRAIYGQWPHAFPDREDWWGEAGILHRWFDHWLQGIDTGILDALPPVLIEDTDDTWRGIDSFPPIEQPWLDLALGTDGTLTAGEVEPGELTVQDLPNAAGVWPLIDEQGSAIASMVTGRPTSLLFVGEPLTEDIVITGRPSVTFTATTSEERTHWVAHLLEISPDGRSTWLDRGYQNTRHLEGLDAPAAVPPGEPYAVTVTMYPQNDAVPAGSRLALWISNDDEWVQQDTTYAASTLTLDGSAVLRIPLLPVNATDVPSDSLERKPG